MCNYNFTNKIIENYEEEEDFSDDNELNCTCDNPLNPLYKCYICCLYYCGYCCDITCYTCENIDYNICNIQLLMNTINLLMHIVNINNFSKNYIKMKIFGFAMILIKRIPDDITYKNATSMQIKEFIKIAPNNNIKILQKYLDLLE